MNQLNSNEFVRVVRTNAQLRVCGSSHHWTKHPDDLVARARTLRRTGQSLRAIGRQLGLHYATVADWVSDPPRSRRPHIRIVVKPIKRAHTPIGDRCQPPAASAKLDGATTPVATPDHDFSDLA